MVGRRTKGKDAKETDDFADVAAMSEAFLKELLDNPCDERWNKYLENSGKIMYDKDGSIIWTAADEPELKKLLRTSTKLR